MTNSGAQLLSLMISFIHEHLNYTASTSAPLALLANPKFFVKRLRLRLASQKLF
jgi:hypothetical protein